MKLRSDASQRLRRGGVLVEFALVSLALYLLLAAVIGLGRWMAVVQSAQDAVRFAAREIALFPLPASSTFDDALQDPDFRAAVYDPGYLAVDLDVYPPGAALDDAFAAMPVVNRALRPLMIVSNVDVGGVTRRILHMPGMLIDGAGPSGLTVVVPRVDARAANGVESDVTIVPVLEELAPSSGDPGPFSVDPSAPLSQRGLVALRLNVPYQSATLSAYVPTAGPNPGDVFNRPVSATDAAVDSNEPGGYAIVGPGPDGTGPYSGTFGLGSHLALGGSVRPFRRLVSAQAIFRREVFRQ